MYNRTLIWLKKAALVLVILSIALAIIIAILPNTKKTESDSIIKNSMPLFSSNTTGIAMQKSEVVDKSLERFDNFDAWNKTRAIKEKQKEYDTIIGNIRKKDAEKKALEEELEHYCNMLYSNSCLNNLRYIEDYNGKTNLKVKCKKFNDDNICIRYKITVLDE